MPNVRRLLEMAMELGGDPDAVHPSHKRALSTGQHGMGSVSGMSPQAAERHASETYRNIVAKLRAYGGVVPRNPRETEGAMIDMMRTLMDIQRREAQHRPQLSQLAVETVLRMPEFKTLRGAIERGDVHINAELKPRISIQNVAFSDEEQEPIEGEDVPEIQAQYKQLIDRRKLSNTLIQGAAVANNYAFTNSFDELADLDHTLVRDYGKVMAYSELGFFVQDQDMMRQAARAAGSALQGGQNYLRKEEDGSMTIVAEAITFPMLVQEIIKGCMEFLSISDDEDPETARAVRSRADFIDDEQVQMQIGPSLYRSFIKAIGEANADLMPYVYDHLNRLPTEEYNEIVRGLLDGSPEATNWFRELASDLRQKLAAQEQGQELGNELLGGEDEEGGEAAY